MNIDRLVHTSPSVRVMLRLADAVDVRRARDWLISGRAPQPPDRIELLDQICGLLRLMRYGDTAGDAMKRLESLKTRK